MAVDSPEIGRVSLAREHIDRIVIELKIPLVRLRQYRATMDGGDLQCVARVLSR